MIARQRESPGRFTSRLDCQVRPSAISHWARLGDRPLRIRSPGLRLLLLTARDNSSRPEWSSRHLASNASRRRTGHGLTDSPRTLRICRARDRPIACLCVGRRSHTHIWVPRETASWYDRQPESAPFRLNVQFGTGPFGPLTPWPRVPRGVSAGRRRSARTAAAAAGSKTLRGTAVRRIQAVQEPSTAMGERHRLYHRLPR